MKSLSFNLREKFNEKQDNYSFRDGCEHTKTYGSRD
jgi:hypothetical protein